MKTIAMDDTERNEQIDELLADGVVKISEAAKMMGLGRTKVTEMCNEGELPFVRYGERSRRIPRRAVVEYLRKRLVLPNADAFSA